MFKAVQVADWETDELLGAWKTVEVVLAHFTAEGVFSLE